jgi:bcr-type benzoyl-CoA reductase subunit C
MTLLREEGLAKAGKYYDQYGLRARELRAGGKKVIGYLSALGPVEIMTAAGVVPLRLKGNVAEAITKGDAYMETIICPFVRNVFDAVVKGRYDFLDGLMLPHQCDSIDRTGEVWANTVNLPYFHFLNVPHVTRDSSVDFMVEILRAFIASLGEFTGSLVTDEELTKAVHAHNENRRLMRRLYELRKASPSPLTGSEMMRVLVAAMSLPVEESSALIEAVTKEIEERVAERKESARIMIVGDQIDDVAIMEAIEGGGARVVMDDLSIGSKMYWGDVEATPDPVRGIAERYLRRLKIPTFFVSEGESYEENLDARFGHLRRYIEEFKVDGVVLLVYKFCDPYGFEVPAVKTFIEDAGRPCSTWRTNTRRPRWQG